MENVKQFIFVPDLYLQNFSPSKNLFFFFVGELGGSPAPDTAINSSADKENTNNSDDNNNSSSGQQQSQQQESSSSQSSLHRIGEAGKIHKSASRHKKGKNKSKHR